MQFRNVLLAATILSLPVALHAQPVSGPYVSGGFGMNLMTDSHVKSFTQSYGGGSTTSSGSFGNDLGLVGVGALGYGLGNGIRVEIEGDWRTNQFGSNAGGVISPHGGEQKYGAMANVLYDLPVHWVVTPYIGAGAGYSWNQLSGTNLTSGGGTGYFNNTRGAFAYQAIAGVAYPVASVPGLSVTGEARFMGTDGNRNYQGVAYSGPAVGGASALFNNDFNWSFLLGLRYAFNHPGVVMASAAPMAPPPAALSRNYLVFFDWDRADLTARAREIVADAAANSHKVAVTKIAVNGYTDLSGTPAYNQQLSVRRAKAVAAELVKDGVPASEIGIQGFGESNPLVKTAEGVREPQNRRVEIVFQ